MERQASGHTQCGAVQRSTLIGHAQSLLFEFPSFQLCLQGFELGLKTMRVGGKRRLVVPPQLGPPTGPSTFFSAKQCEVWTLSTEVRKAT